MLKYLCATLFLLSSCSSKIMTIYSDYVDETTLASYYAKTPDPRLSSPPAGQRLIINYALPKNLKAATDIYLSITIRFKNREELTEFFPLKNSGGRFIYSLLNEKYRQKGGILSYKAQLIKGSRVIEEHRHQLWAEVIRFE